MPPRQNSLANRVTLHLYGNSLIANVFFTLKPQLKGQNPFVISHSKRGSFFFPGYRTFIPPFNNEADTLVFHILGNESLNIAGHRNYGGKCHLFAPSLLTNDQINGLLIKSNKLLVDALERFPGKIKFLLPFPRFLDGCCKLSNHIRVTR